MRVVQINAYCSRGSTGKICEAISKRLTTMGIENYVIYTQGDTSYENAIKCSYGDLYSKIQSLKSRIYGNNGFNSMLLTKKIINVLNEINPDIVHLHNLHAQNCNLEMIACYLKQKGIKSFWTFHDCWMFTGYCMYYDVIGCEKWKHGCGKCPQSKSYSWIKDRSRRMWQRKRAMLRDWDITIVTPSDWLSRQVKGSFLKDKRVVTIKNGIDLNVFFPKESHFRRKYGLEDKKIVLGVADLWDKRKGIDTFIYLSNNLSDDFQVVLVGVDKKTKKKLPSAILTISHTESVDELVGIYSASDVFVNPTIDEVFGLVNIESLACGTPVVMYDTGGSPECIDNKTGIVVPKYNRKELLMGIKSVCNDSSFRKKDFIDRAALFDCNSVYEQYCNLYLDSKDNMNDDQII